MAILKEYTDENGIRITFHDDYIETDEEQAELLKAAGKIYIEAMGKKDDVCNLSS